jgi:uncharacterized membrane protein YgdD (TMEM256/DUF423 family)
MFLLLGSINAFLAVALGAFGAHGLKSRLTADRLAVYQTGVHYHLAHALGLILIALLAERLPASAPIQWSGWLLTTGIVLFSGSLYLLAISGVRVFGAITPLGGLCFLTGWALLAVAAAKVRAL